MTTSDPDDEVRAVVRGVVDAMRDGVPLERMAVLYASNDPYAQLLHEHFELAGIAHNGASVRALDDSVLGRALLRLLALPDDGFRRDALFTLLAAAPMLDGKGHSVPSAAWERVSRLARVVGGLEQWHVLLDAYAAELGERDWDARERARVGQLRAFVDALADDLDPARVPASWSAKARWAHRLIRRWIGDERRREIVAGVRAGSGAVASKARSTGWPGWTRSRRRPSMAVFRRTLELELAAARERIGRLGEGVLVGPVGFALGADLDRVFVCGLAEGVFPAAPGDDPLLSDNERAALARRARVARRSDGSRPPRAARGAGRDRRRSRAVLPAR